MMKLQAESETSLRGEMLQSTVLQRLHMRMMILLHFRDRGIVHMFFTPLSTQKRMSYGDTANAISAAPYFLERFKDGVISHIKQLKGNTFQFCTVKSYTYIARNTRVTTY